MIPNRYMTIGERGIASYNFTDIASNFGYVTFYGMGTSLVGEYAAPAILNTAIEPGNTDATTSGTHERRSFFPALNPSTVTLSGSIFNLPARAQGMAYINFTLTTTSTNTAGAYDVIASILKNGVVQFSGSNVYSLPSTASKNKTFNIPINISTVLSFAKGDTMAIQISEGAVSGTRTVYLQTDPLNRDVASYVTSGNGTHPAITATANPTKLTAFIPFIIDL